MTIVIHNCLNIKVNLPEFTVRPNPHFPILDNDKYVYVKVCVCVYFLFVCVCVCVCLFDFVGSAISEYHFVSVKQ